MEKKEFAIGEEFQMGLTRLRVEKDSKTTPCKGCIFDSSDITCENVEDFVGRCLGCNRSDRTDVIFVEVK